MGSMTFSIGAFGTTRFMSISELPRPSDSAMEIAGGEPMGTGENGKVGTWRPPGWVKIASIQQTYGGTIVACSLILRVNINQIV